jgi:predicted lipid-binding transport protein (Tim44 family)
LIALVGFSVTAFDTDARRMGGGRNVGTQREAINPKQASRPPAQQQNAQNASPQQPAPQASGMSRWLGPLAGLAIGAGLASLFFNNGLGGALAGILLVAALAIGLVFLVRLLRRPRPTAEPLRYAAANPYGGSVPEPVQSPAPAAFGGVAAPHSVAATTGSVGTQWPADFDEHEFRDFLTPEVCREIESDMRAAGDATQKTDVVTLNAEVLDVVTEHGKYVVSVRFSGLIREAEGTEPQPFSEIWHLEKPVSGRSGWLVSGIQQA